MSKLRDIAHRLLEITHGRSTAFWIAFFVCGHVMALTGKLTAVYVGFMATLGGLVLGHSAKDDYFSQDATTAPPAAAPGAPDTNPG